MGKNAWPVSQQACCCLPLDAGILAAVIALVHIHLTAILGRALSHATLAAAGWTDVCPADTHAAVPRAQAVGCGLMILFVTGEILTWQLEVMGMLGRRGESSRTFLGLTGAEVIVLGSGVAAYALSSHKTWRMRQWGVWGEPELEQMRKQLKPSAVITVCIILMWIVRVAAWVPAVCALEYDLAVIYCRDQGYPEDGPGWDDHRGEAGCGELVPAWWHHGASQGPGMCKWELDPLDPATNASCALDMTVVDNTIADCESTRRVEEGLIRLPLLLLALYHVYLVHCHTLTVAGTGTSGEQMIKDTGAPNMMGGAAASAAP